MPAQLAFSDARGGMNAADPANRIAINQLARMVNCRLFQQLPSTRLGVRVIPLAGDASEAISAGNVQGSIFFNPAKGQGGIALADDSSMIATAATGRKFVVKIVGRRGKTQANIVEVAPGMFTEAQLHLSWINGWEDLLLFQDGAANCIIWDGYTAEYSQGYNTVQKERSMVPNNATVMAYAHGRGVVGVNGRFVLASNSLHELDQSTAGDLLRFTEQAYWATGAYFMPPSAMGGINAMAILPQRNTQHGHGDLMVHCQDGIFSIDLNVFPRSSWGSTPMVKHALLDCGAVGPYAIGIQDGDQIFRSRKGIQTLRSSAAESTLEGNPNQSISHEIETWLSGDYPRWLRFASLALWDTGRRFLCTTGPIVQGRYRWHRGCVVRNVDPKETELNTKPAWEGLWTLPPEIGGIVQFVSGIFDGDERLFAWCRASDGRNRLVEFTNYLAEDVLEDGTRRPIRSQAITRQIDGGLWYQERQFESARLYLRNITTPIKWGVWVRGARNPEWTPLQTGTVDFKTPDLCDLTSGTPRALPIPLGRIPEKCYSDGDSGKMNETSGVQFLVRWEGQCTLEGVRVVVGDKDLTNDDIAASRFKVEFANPGVGDYDDFEFNKYPEAIYFT
jgi:hypothetical protein